MKSTSLATALAFAVTSLTITQPRHDLLDRSTLQILHEGQNGELAMEHVIPVTSLIVCAATAGGGGSVGNVNSIKIDFPLLLWY